MINASRDIAEAAANFSRYWMVVLGDGLQEPRHPNHDATREIVAGLPEVEFFGYIDLGVHSPAARVQNLQMAEIRRRCEAWRKLGTRGILLDDYGYDYATTRQRQTDAVDAVHQAGMNVIANSWDPRHALDGESGPGNPKGLPTPLTAKDYYLYESYLVNDGEWINFKNWRAKANTLEKLARKTRVGVLSCTTTTHPESEQSRIDFAWKCAWVEGHAGWAWGEPNFGASDNRSPYRERPQPPAERRRPNLRPVGQYGIECGCESGRVIADYANKEIRVEPRPSLWRRWFRLT